MNMNLPIYLLAYA